MNDEEANAYVRRVAKWHGEATSPLTTTVALSSVPAVKRAFERLGLIVEEGEGAGRVVATKPEPVPAEGIVERIGRAVLGELLRRSLRRADSAALLETSEARVSAIYARRFDDVGLSDLRRMATLLREKA